MTDKELQDIRSLAAATERPGPLPNEWLTSARSLLSKLLIAYDGMAGACASMTAIAIGRMSPETYQSQVAEIEQLSAKVGELERERSARATSPCTVYGTFCMEHNFVHGAEAEELRKGIENLIEDPEQSLDHASWDDSLVLVKTSRLQSLLDRVDARDSLAFVDATKPEPDNDDEPEPPALPYQGEF